MQYQRYIRQMNLPGFGREAQLKLAAAKVLVVGGGGLGVPAIQYLCAMGTGTIGIVDDDVVSIHNLHRQVLYTMADIGRPKVEAATERLTALNPAVAIQPYNQRLTSSNALSIIEAYDLVIDGSDNFATRYLINDACVILEKPFVYGAAQGYEGQFTVFNLGAGPTYRCLFPQRPAPGLLPDCNSGGVLPLAPAIIGSFQALEAVKIITGIGETVSGHLQVYDFRYNTHHPILLNAVPENKQREKLDDDYSDETVSTDATAISTQQLHTLMTGGTAPLLIDVREEWEFEFDELQSAMRIPIDGLPQALPALTAQAHIVVVCQFGKRSRTAATWLRDQLPGNTVQSLSGGMDAWNKDYPEQFLQD